MLPSHPPRADGRLDPSFGRAGIVPLLFEDGPGGRAELYSAIHAASPDGRIAVGGGARVGAQSDISAPGLADGGGTA